jgi:hypothetical protein
VPPHIAVISTAPGRDAEYPQEHIRRGQNDQKVRTTPECLHEENDLVNTLQE